MGTKKNITVTLAGEVSSWVRVWAAQHGVSTSRMIAEMLEEKMVQEDQYAQAMQRVLGSKPRKLRTSKRQQLPGRDSLYD